MKLSELFPTMPKVVIGEVEYEVKFGTRSLIQLDGDYPNQGELAGVLKTIVTGVKPLDLVNLLYAGLMHAKSFKDKDTLIDAMEPIDFNNYADAILSAYMRSSVSPEQLEKLEVLAADSKKKTEVETSRENMPSTE